MKNSLLFSCVAVLIICAAISCSNQPQNQTVVNSDTAQSTTTPVAAAPAVTNEKATVNFKVNGAVANTKKGTGNDTEEQLGMFNFQNNNLTFDLMGDAPERPHRGWLHFSISNFKLAAGTYTVTGDNNASFARYETAGAGSPTEYNANAYPNYKGSEFSIQFTKVEKHPTEIGEEYLASGTFSAKLLLNESSKSDSKNLDITEGKFEDVPIRLLGKK